MSRFIKNPYAWLFLSLLALVIQPALAVNYVTWNFGQVAGYGGATATQWVTGFGISPLTGISVAGPSIFGSDFVTSGTFTPKRIALAPSSTYNLTSSAIILTSPTVSFNANGQNFISLTTNASQTGVYPTGTSIVVGDVLLITAGAGTNTIRFDDNTTTLALGANITLTQGNDCFLALICTAVQGTNSRPRFARLYSSVN